VRRLALVLSALCLAGLAGAQEVPKESPLFRGLGIAYLILGSADTAQTAYAMGQGGYHEMNPILRPVADKPVALGALKMAVPLTFTYGTAQLWKSPKANDRTSAVVLRVIAVALQGGVVVWNARQLRRHP
jgi:hypothetical protein